DEVARGAIDPVQLAPCLEAAEDLVALAEEPLDGPLLRRRRAADDDLAAHRLEPPLGHETAVAASRGACAGATLPAWGRLARPHGPRARGPSPRRPRARGRCRSTSARRSRG